jgi:hypothetical protein
MLAHLRTEAYDYMKKPIYPSSPKEHRGVMLSFQKQLDYTKKASSTITNEKRALKGQVGTSSEHLEEDSNSSLES